MLCEKCEKMSCISMNRASALSAKLGMGGAHVVNNDWYPGDSRKILEDWCAENCKPAKSVEPVKEVKEEITPPSPLKDKWVQSSNKNLKPTDKKKVDSTSKPSWNYKNKKKD